MGTRIFSRGKRGDQNFSLRQRGDQNFFLVPPPWHAQKNLASPWPTQKNSGPPWSTQKKILVPPRERTPPYINNENLRSPFWEKKLVPPLCDPLKKKTGPPLTIPKNSGPHVLGSYQFLPGGGVRLSVMTGHHFSSAPLPFQEKKSSPPLCINS